MADMTKAERRANEIQEQISALIKEYGALDPGNGAGYKPAAVVMMTHPAPSEGETQAKVLDMMFGEPLILGRVASVSQVADALIRYRHAYEQTQQIKGARK